VTIPIAFLIDTVSSFPSTGFGKTSLNRRGRVMPGKRHPYGVITGLAARKATGIRKGISPMNRPPLSDRVG
jgi:hypothetical protein